MSSEEDLDANPPLTPPPLPFNYRNWADLSHDILSLIFNKSCAVEILMRAQFVCKPWRQLSLDPTLWKKVDMTTLHGGDNNEEDCMEELAKEAVVRSRGLLEEFWVEDFGSDELLMFIAERTTRLRCLRLISAYDVTNEGLVEAISRFPFLEELDITIGSLSGDICKSVGQACPHLKIFRRNTKGSRSNRYECDEEALGVANNMPELRELQLIGNYLTNEGLRAILDKCVHLESLDLRCCFNVNFNASIRANCKRLKNLRLPTDPTDDYGFEAVTDDDGSFDDDCLYDYPDIEMMYDDMFFDQSDMSEDDYPDFL